MAQGDKHHIDELLRAKLSAPKSDIKSDWNTFSAKLAVAQKRKRKLRIAIVMSSLVAILLVIGLFGTDLLIQKSQIIEPSIKINQPITDTPTKNTNPANTIEQPIIDSSNETEQSPTVNNNSISQQSTEVEPNNNVVLKNEVPDNTNQPTTKNDIITEPKAVAEKPENINESEINNQVNDKEVVASDVNIENSPINPVIAEETNNNADDDISEENTKVDITSTDKLEDKNSINDADDINENTRNTNLNNNGNATNQNANSNTTPIPDSTNTLTNKGNKDTTNQTATSKKEPTIKPSTKSTKWILSFNAYSNYTVRDVKIEDNGSVHKDFKDILLSSEKTGYSTNFGFEVRYRPLPFLTLGSGIHYTQNRTVGSFDFTNDQVPVIDTTGAIVGYITLDSSQVRSVNQRIDNRFNYIEIPFLLTYEKQLSKKWYLNTEIGASMLFFLNSKGETISSFSLETASVPNQPSKSTLGSLHVRAGLLYNFTDNWFVGIEPTYKYYLGNVFKNDSPIKINQYTIGLNMSIQYRIK